jgi:D-3-phosphoglycerate dehydrogenase
LNFWNLRPKNTREGLVLGMTEKHLKSNIPKVIVTCPAMVQNREFLTDCIDATKIHLEFVDLIANNLNVSLPKLLCDFDGWIAGDEHCTVENLKIAHAKALKAIVKWGVGTDNFDLEQLEILGIRFSNTPNMLGKEVADLALTYINLLARDVILTHESVKSGQWLKKTGLSLADSVIGIVGFGDIGKNLTKRLLAAEVKPLIYEKADFPKELNPNLTFEVWPNSIDQCDFIVFCCPLNVETRRMFNLETLKLIGKPKFIVNMSRGHVIDENALLVGLDTGKVAGAALDVYESEPLPGSHPLLSYDNVVFGAHNASNTRQAVLRTSREAILRMQQLLESL